VALHVAPSAATTSAHLPEVGVAATQLQHDPGAHPGEDEDQADDVGCAHVIADGIGEAHRGQDDGQRGEGERR
jgi:hypothetical protein